MALSLLYGPTLKSIHKKKPIALSIWTFVGKIIFLFNMLSRFVIAFLPRSKDLAVGKYLLNRSQKILNLF